MPNNKLRVLCLHGCRQDGKLFNQKTGQLRKVLKTLSEFDYMSAPNSISSFDDTDSYDYRSWWYTSPERVYSSLVASETDEGFGKSIQVVQEHLKENGPYDGILAFSQGASLLGMMCLMKNLNEFDGDFRFVVLVSGFKSPCIPHQKYYGSTRVKIPSLHIMGEGDRIILKERSEELMSFFENPEVIVHAGGHHVPAGKEEKEQYITFFKKMLSFKEDRLL